MREEIRRCIAYAVAIKTTNQSLSSIYSYHTGAYSMMSSSGSGYYDYEVGAHISSNGNNLYHYSFGHHISLTINDSQFSGYDFGQSHHYSGSINGRSIQIYDYGDSNWYNYSF